MESFTILALNILWTILGYAFHVTKKCLREEIPPWDYFEANKKRTLSSLSAIITAFVALITTRPNATPVEFFSIGYIGDSVVNRKPTNQEQEAIRKKRAEK